MKKFLKSLLFILFISFFAWSIVPVEAQWSPANFWKQVGNTIQLWNTDLVLTVDDIAINGTCTGTGCGGGGTSSLNHTEIFVGDSSNIAQSTSSITVLDNGNVGIGSTTPSNKLSVAGTIYSNQGKFNINQTNPPYEESIGFYDNLKKAWSYYNEESDVTVNIGREILVRVYNDSGATITNGSVVYPSGADAGTGLTTIACANAQFKEKSRLIGMATHDIEDSSIGYVTLKGDVGGLNTTGLAGVIYLATTDCEYTLTPPDDGAYTTTVGAVGKIDGSDGTIVVDTVISQITVEVTDTNGFPPTERATTTISFDDGTRTFTIAPISDSYHFYELGDKYEITTATSTTIPDEEGLYVFYFNEGVLTYVKNPSDGQVGTVIRTKALVSYIYWDATNNIHNYLGDERHGISMSPETHAYLHFTQGAKYLQGLALNTMDVDGSGDDNTAAQFGIDSGLIADEDIVHSISSVLSTTGFPVFYLEGTTPNMRRDSLSGYAVLTDVSTGVGVTGRPVYNELSGSAWQLTAVANGDYLLTHIFAINDPDQSAIAVMGQETYATVGLARTGAEIEISNILTLLPQEELLPVATVIYQSRDVYTNAVKARIRTTDEGEDYVNWTLTEITPGSAPSAHPNLSSLLWADAGHTGTVSTFAGFNALGAAAYYTEANYLYTDGTRALTGNLNLGTNAITNGDWNGNTIAETYGGTGLNTYTVGDILISSTTDELLALSIGNTGDVLSVQDSRPIWVATSTLGISGGGGDTFPWEVNGNDALNYIGIGSGALDSITSGSRNIGIGLNAGTTITTSNDNIAIGDGAGDVNTSSQWVAIGSDAMGDRSSGSGNIAIGNLAMYSGTGEQNVAIGYASLKDQTTSSNANTAVGYQALGDVTSGDNNTGIGAYSTYLVTTGSNNTGLGAFSNRNQKTGSENTAVGAYSGYGRFNTGENGNTMIGYYAGYAVDTGANYNTLIGRKAGDSITTGGNNVMIGNDTDTPAATDSYRLNIGNTIFGDMSTGYIGIGTSSPSQALTVEGSVLADDYLTYSPDYNGEAIIELIDIGCEVGSEDENGWCAVDHKTLPEGLRETKEVVYKEQIGTTSIEVIEYETITSMEEVTVLEDIFENGSTTTISKIEVKPIDRQVAKLVIKEQPIYKEFTRVDDLMSVSKLLMMVKKAIKELYEILVSLTSRVEINEEDIYYQEEIITNLEARIQVLEASCIK